MKLYEMVNQYRELMNMAEDIDNETLLDTLESIGDAIEVKADNTAKMIRTFELEAEMIKAEENRLAERRKAITKKATTLANYLQTQLEMLDVDKIKSPTFTITLRQNPPKVSITDESQIPLQFYTIPQPVISKSAIANTIKAGIEVPGATLIREKGLQIK